MSTAQNPRRVTANSVRSCTLMEAGFRANLAVTGPVTPEARAFYARHGDPCRWTAHVFKTYFELGGDSCRG
ncbi:hypothetical protein O1L44_16195 [Streptomyces noursei]|uniref:hypothetical protein n=1 Tax=Streptomyces noursei TaxID=1971 RepID=UPI0013520A40|nr:hypothetical protein [Streptomyces noursei]